MLCKIADWYVEVPAVGDMPDRCADYLTDEAVTPDIVIREADFAMYDAKAAYYAQTGKERRKRHEAHSGRHESIL